MLSFKDFMVVDYTPGMPELISYAAHKRHRGRIGEDTADEALDMSQRRARARTMKRIKAKLAIGRRRAMKRPADKARLQKRADKQARMTLFKKFSKGKGRGDLPAARKKEIEKRLDKMGDRIKRISRKLLPQVRKQDRERRQSKNKEK